MGRRRNKLRNAAGLAGLLFLEINTEFLKLRTLVAVVICKSSVYLSAPPPLSVSAHSLCLLWRRHSCQPKPQLLILHSTVTLFRKKFLFLKNFDDAIRRDLRFGHSPAIKDSGNAYVPCQCFLSTLIAFD